MLIEFFDVNLRWRPLEREASAIASKQLGCEDWREGLLGGAPDPMPFYDAALAANGGEELQRRYDALYERLTHLAETVIVPKPARTIEDLRAKTLVVLLEMRPTFIHGGELGFPDDGGATRALFDAAAAISGLTPLVQRIEKGMAEDAALDDDVTGSGEAVQS